MGRLRSLPRSSSASMGRAPAPGKREASSLPIVHSAMLETGETGRGDLLLANARVITLDPRRPRAAAVAARAGRIVAVGSLDALRPLVGPDAEIVDAEGGVAGPAFHAAHLHLFSYARTRSRVDCRAARSIGALQATLAAGARGLPPGAWLRAYGSDEGRLAEGRQPDRDDLDAAVPDRPLRLQHRGLHLDVLNTLGLRALGSLAAAPA